LVGFGEPDSRTGRSTASPARYHKSLVAAASATHPPVACSIRTIIVESPDRFARDLAVQLAGHDFLKNLGVSLIPATAPDFFLEDTPTAVLGSFCPNGLTI
jgi:hypothetical protein